VGGVQAFWYVTRAAGLVAYLLLWLSTAWGLAVSSKIFDPLFHRAFTYDMHQFISLLAIGFTILHIVVLFADQYLPFSLAAVLVPFVAPYRPVWVGIGIIGLYLTLLVSVTFYIRQWIGQKAFRVIHLLSFVGYISVTLHGLMAGTDSPLWTVQLMYAGSALAIVFLTAYWMLMGLVNKLSVRGPGESTGTIRTLSR
jgi:predicted ferric reductase